MRTIFIALMLLATLMVCPAPAHTIRAVQAPSDLITYTPPPGVLDLQHVSPGAARAIDALNANLTAYQGRKMPDLGHYYGVGRDVVQKELTGVPSVLLNFSAAKVPIPTSIKNDTQKV